MAYVSCIITQKTYLSSKLIKNFLVCVARQERIVYTKKNKVEVILLPFMKERLKEQRNSQNITLLEVAAHVGVTEATIQRYECGKILKLDTRTVEKLAQAVKCSPSYLMGWVDNPMLSNSIHVGGSVTNGAVVNSNANSTAIVSTNGLSPETTELLRIYESLDVKKRIKLLEFAFSLEE